MILLIFISGIISTPEVNILALEYSKLKSIKNKKVLEEEFRKKVIIDYVLLGSLHLPDKVYMLAFTGVKYLNVTQIKMLMIHYKIISSCNEDAFLIIQ